MKLLTVILTAGAIHAPAVSQQQARHAIRADFRFPLHAQIACHQERQAQQCDVTTRTPFTDTVIGPAVLVGTTIVRVTHGGHVRIVASDHFDIYGQVSRAA